jgi:hypothetical protein
LGNEAKLFSYEEALLSVENPGLYEFERTKEQKEIVEKLFEKVGEEPEQSLLDSIFQIQKDLDIYTHSLINEGAEPRFYPLLTPILLYRDFQEHNLEITQAHHQKIVDVMKAIPRGYRASTPLTTAKTLSVLAELRDDCEIYFGCFEGEVDRIENTLYSIFMNPRRIATRLSNVERLMAESKKDSLDHVLCVEKLINSN